MQHADVHQVLWSGEIMVSAMGDAHGKGRGGYVLLDQDFKVRVRAGHAAALCLSQLLQVFVLQ